jgi:hypothetical protein
MAGASEPIAVLTPVHDRPELIARLASTVLPELRADDRFVIVDDGSAQPVAHDDPRVTVVRHDRNRGVLAARNTLLNSIPAHCSWALFMDSDDVMVPGWRSLVDEAAEAVDPRVMVFFDRRIEGTTRLAGFMRHPGTEITLADRLDGGAIGDFVVLFPRSLDDGWRYDESAWAFDGALWAHYGRSARITHRPFVIAEGPESGASADSVIAASLSPSRARGIARGADSFMAALGPELPARFPAKHAELQLTRATWQIIAGDAGPRDVWRLRGTLATPGGRLRWARLLGASALPHSVRNALLARRLGVA